MQYNIYTILYCLNFDIFVLLQFINIDSWIKLISFCCIYGCIYIVMLYIIGLTKEQKVITKQKMKVLLKK